MTMSRFVIDILIKSKNRNNSSKSNSRPDYNLARRQKYQARHTYQKKVNRKLSNYMNVDLKNNTADFLITKRFLQRKVFQLISNENFQKT